MNTPLQNLEPQALWNNFTKLNAVPRPSKKEEKVVAFIVDFAKSRELEYVVDDAMNVIIKKPASAWMEKRKKIVLQSHLDMVHQKNNDVQFDFANEWIKMKIEWDWVKAEWTTLGADNGIGVATIMAILESTDIAHPALEALFTVDEETGMTWAFALQAGYLNGEILLNLDTEDDDELTIGCAGGIDLTATKEYAQEETNGITVKVSISWLNWGHSGVQIHEWLANANVLVNRVLYALKDEMRISEMLWGWLRNAIPRESNAIIVTQNIEKFNTIFEVIKQEIVDEYKTLEQDISIEYSEEESWAMKVMSPAEQDTFLSTVYSVHNGVFRMSPDIADLVETSNNLARIEVQDGNLEVQCLIRSSVDSWKQDILQKISSTFALADYTVKTWWAYPGWKPNTNSEILTLCEKTYEALFQEKPKVLACHAWLECGILGQNYPNMDMISFGPTIKWAHSPDERASISSVQKFWKYTLELLKNIPEKSL